MCWDEAGEFDERSDNMEEEGCELDLHLSSEVCFAT